MSGIKKFKEVFIYLGFLITMIYLYNYLQESEKQTDQNVFTTPCVPETSTFPTTTLSSTTPLPPTPPPRYALIGDSELSPKNTSLIYALFFNSFNGVSPSWGLEKEVTAPEDLASVNCPHTNCIFTYKSDVLPKVHDFDAVFINAWWQDTLQLPATRHPQQLYIFSTNEAPARMNHNLSKDPNIFNLTMTSRLDSDIPWPYGEVTEISSSRVVAPAVDVLWKQPDANFKDERILEIVKNKTKMAAWFASNSNAPSRRINLVHKLQNIGIEIDIYGPLGNLTLPIDPIVENELLEKNYKFYLSFENSLCVDYVSEKLYKVMNSYIIPVVYAGADLSRFAPPNSYINANSFETAEELAEYLKFFSENPEEYVKFFWWKGHYKVRTIDQITFDRVHMCNVCKKLNTLNMKYKQQIFSSIYYWFHHETCKTPKIKF